MTTSFVRYRLRTTHVDAARAFYDAILDEGAGEVFPLEEQALARGARPHWLGHLAAAHVVETASAFVAHGATQLGPTIATSEAGMVAVVRDPGGAVVAFTDGPPAPRGDVVWHLLNTSDRDRAVATYRDVLGMSVRAAQDLGALGVFEDFAWAPDGADVGSITDITGKAGRHAHWLFQFRVRELDRKLAHVRSADGLVLDPLVLPSGERLAVCDDPQGGAFSLRGA